MHVRISKSGRKILNNRNLSNRLADAIINGKDDFEKNGYIIMKGIDGEKEEHQIKLVTSIKEANL